MKALDIETRSLVDDHPEYALQPWRVVSGEAEITMVAVGDSTYAEFLEDIPPDTYVCWNALFDMTFLAARGEDITKNKWLDAMLLCKWAENCQDNDKLGYSLVKCAKRWLQDWELLEKFVKLKETEADPSYDKYWKVRAKLDVMATHLIATKALRRLTPHQRRSAMIEAGNLVPNALAYLSGVPTNERYYEDPIPGLQKEMAQIECRLGVSNPGEAEEQLGGKGWLPSKILRSPKQLAETLYKKWGLPLKHTTEKGAPATDKTALTYLADKDDKALEILRWRHLNTRLTKFCQSPAKAAKYLGSSRLHPEPKVFSTYTGRYTYGSKSGKNLISMALHQIPRGPDVRRMVEAPEGKMLVEFDASGQEARLLAEIGDVYTMLDVFQGGKKIHAVMGASIAGIPYEEFMRRYKAGEESYAGPEGLYYCGKFCNLSMQYRVGAAKHRVMARVQYGLQKDMTTINRWRSLYHSTYPEVKSYWQRSINLARTRGYAETLAGRRYYISKWDEDSRWSSESSAINFPIQGSGADMKNLAITQLAKHFPQFEFVFDVHDGIFVWAEKSKQGMQDVLAAREMLNNMDYEAAWGWKPRIPLSWDASVGVTWGEMKEI
jgi:DNA polymerase I-like protein with 3'-5' exonuclease and polymerase domains